MLSLYQDPSDQCYKESMMLEAVNPVCPQNIHVATVTKVKGQHIWIRLEGDSAIYAIFCFEILQLLEHLFSLNIIKLLFVNVILGLQK